jgi:hypothetical protein
MAPKELNPLHKFAVHYPVEDKAVGLDLAQRNVVKVLVRQGFVGQELLALLILELNVVREIYEDDIEQSPGK